MGSEDQGVSTGSLNALISAAGIFQPQIGVQFEVHQFNSTQDKAAYFGAFLTVGTLPYAASPSGTAGTKDVIISYMDKDGNPYVSTDVQSGSMFNIVSITRLQHQPAIMKV